MSASAAIELQRDRAMLERYRAGDRATLELLYRQYSAEVLRGLARGFRLSSDPSSGHAQVGPLDLDAVHQETFIRAFSESARLHYDGLQPFLPYLMAIARRAAVDVLRAQGKIQREAVPLDDAPQAQSKPDQTDTPEQAALRHEAATVVRAFLKTLEGDALTFATARFIDGESQADAGLRCGWSRQNARTQEARLKAACIRYLCDTGWLEASGSHAAVVTLVLSMILKVR